MLGPFLLNSNMLADSRVLEGWVLVMCASHCDMCLLVIVTTLVHLLVWGGVMNLFCVVQQFVGFVTQIRHGQVPRGEWEYIYPLDMQRSFWLPWEFVSTALCVIENAWCIENERIMTLWYPQYIGQKAASSPWQGVTRLIFHVLIYSNACTWVFPNHPQYISQKSCFLSLDGMLLI